MARIKLLLKRKALGSSPKGHELWSGTMVPASWLSSSGLTEDTSLTSAPQMQSPPGKPEGDG